MDAATNSPTLTVIGDYRIVREIGRGGMGVVYEAVQTSLGRKVALKILSTGLGLTPQAVQRFQREAESAARLHHTNIVPIYATGAEHGVHFYAMELIEGPSLDHVIRQMRDPQRHDLAAIAPVEVNDSATTLAYENQSRQPSGAASAFNSSALSSNAQYFDTVARLMAEVADALAYAHRTGVVHRDIKPANLLVSPEGRLSLNDFGLARVLEQPGMTTTGEILGTPAYMSPEQLTAGRTPLDHRTDIYSLGATLYELLTLHRPFVDERRDQVLSQILHKEPRPPRSLNKKVPLDLETICLKAMEKDPDRRYQSADEMAEDLRRYVNRFAISARRVGPIGKTTKWIRRHPGMSAGIACAGLAIILAAIFANRANEAERRRLTEQELSQQHLTTLEQQHALENALVAATSGDLDRAEKAINEAEAKGASDTQLRVLRGQVAYFNGDFEQALGELEQAATLEPESAAARGMLALTYLNIGNYPRFRQELTALTPIRPTSDEDHLFKGYAQGWINPRDGLQMLNEAVERMRSPLAYAIRVDVRGLVAEDASDAGEAERALSDIRAAKAFLPDNPVVLSISVLVHVRSANVYRESKQLDREHALLKEALPDAKALEEWQRMPYPAAALWSFYAQSANDAKLFEVCQRASEGSSVPAILVRYAILLCRRGEFDQALRVLDRRKWNEIDGDGLRTYILAELHPENLVIATTSNDELAARYSPGISAESEMEVYRCSLLLLGQKTKPSRHIVSPENGCLRMNCTDGSLITAAGI